MYIDSHCHLDRLDLTPYDGDFSKMLDAAKENGVGRFLCVAIDLETFEDVYELARTHDSVVASVGVHPLYQESREPTLQELVELGSRRDVVAIGETGLDYYYCKGDLEWQRERFKTHVQAAVKADKPLIIHTRDAKEDTIEILQKGGADAVGGVLHCFTEDLPMAEQALELGFYISFSGILTFRNAAELREVAKSLPMDRVLIETDSPYLAPVPFRGKSNEPKYVTKVAECLAELRSMDVESVAQQTSNNFRRLFGVD